MQPLRPLTTLLCVLVAVGAAGCGDDGPTTTSASTVPPAMAEQGSRGGTATGATAPPTGDVGAYAQDGRAASEDEAVAVRRGFRAFAEAVADRDADTACAAVTGFQELLRARGQQGSCRELLPAIGNSAAGPSPRDLELIDDADVVIAGDRATLSLGSEAPVPMHLESGAWKLDYAAFAATPKGR
ncbi:hypothetical protein [Patulibacter sp.]|uniref:hypothetical protein n=1 Tax=Patulibacter sp. TaxID=1912859 RepID=UPI0027199969|nr:hypothetical protein [Patulibacter sp.]MDO9407620.1 hypothetical protein [Patulibacter sp.]